MKLGISFEVSTIDFSHAVEIMEVTFGYEGQEWEKVKNTNDLRELIDFLEAEDVDCFLFPVK